MAVVKVDCFERYLCRTCGWTKRVTKGHALVPADHVCFYGHARPRLEVPDVYIRDLVFVTVVEPIQDPESIQDPEVWHDWLEGPLWN